MNRFIKIAMLCLLAMVLLVSQAPSSNPLSSFLGVSEAQAQQKKRKSLFSILFGKKKARKKEVKRRSAAPKAKKRRVQKKKAPRKRKATVKRSTSSPKKTTATVGAAAALAAAPEIVEKLENAKMVMVVGDFYAAGLADGLEVGFAELGGIEVIDKSSGSSGLVRTDIVEWPDRLATLTAEVNPDYIVMMVGSNDRQLMRDEGKNLKKRTEEWDAAYTKRVAALGEALKATGKPFTWVGLPPVRFNSMNTDFLVFNEWYRNAAASAQGNFVDIWDGFADADGAYTRSGPDVNGQIVLLRPKDGINLTNAGKRRLGFYVEGDIRRQLGGLLPTSALDDFSGVGGLSRKEPEYDPAKSGKTRVISLDDPASDGADDLAGAELDRSSSLATDSAVQIIADTNTTRPPSGRVDSFVWPPVDAEATGSSAVASSQSAVDPLN